ncbi:MAG: hypothetical protein ABI758_02635 [Candidatus Woesebacteria bacterium]
MDTPQTTIPPVEPIHTPKASPARFFLFGGIVLVAIVSVMLAILLPNTDNRDKASTTAACAGKVVVAPGACNGKCAVDADCTSGMVCYKTSGQTEGVCRNSTNVTSTTCNVVTSPSPTPVPPTSTPTTACANFVLPVTRVFKKDDATDVVKLVSGGPVTYSWVGTFPTDNYRQFGEGSGTLTNGQSFTITYPSFDTWGKADKFGANEAHVTVHFNTPCGYKGYGWDRWFHLATLSDGTVGFAPTQTQPTMTNPWQIGLISTTTKAPVAGYEKLADGAVIPASVLQKATLAAYPTSSSTTVGSVGFTLDGKFVQYEGSAPYTINPDTNGLPTPWNVAVGTHVVKVTTYTGASGAGTASTPLSIGIQVK